MKSVRIRIFPGPYFPSFGLSPERYSVSFQVQSEYGKTRKTPNTGTFHAVNVFIIKKPTTDLHCK